MKILFFIDSLCAGGKERRLVELMKGLRLNPEVNFELVIMKKEVHYQQALDLNINIHYLLRKTKKDLSVFRKFYKICKDYKPDIVHCWNSMTAVIAVPSCKLLNILFVNGMVVDTPIKQTIFNEQWLRAKLTFPFSNKIVGNSKAGLVAYKASPKKSTCIYNGMDFKRFENLKEPAIIQKEIFEENFDGFFVAGMVAGFDSRKDYETLIKGAIPLIGTNDSLRFVLVGAGNKFAEIKNSVPPSLKNKIIFLGKRTDVESIINLFDVGILLTNSKVHGEGVSNSIIEYMALSKPVIATRGGGTNEVVFDNKNGFLIDPDNSDQFIESVQKLIDSKELCIKFGKAGTEIVHTSFDLEIMTDNYILMYKNLIQEKKN
jgi:Glycosyltransferase